MMRASRVAVLAVAFLVSDALVPVLAAEPETFLKHVVVAQERHAAEAGREILRDGGNAVDAAIATALALAVTLPEAGNLGGGGFMVAYLADRREVITIDFRETAPRAAGPRTYLAADGSLRPRHRAGAWAAGVPGTVRGLGLAHSRFGRAPWPNLVRPAVRLARDGFPISTDLADSLNRQLTRAVQEETASTPRGHVDRLGDFPESIAAFGRTDQRPWRAGDRLVQSDLAATLERISLHGPDEFYTGKTAEQIVEYMNAHSGLIRHDDLRDYQAKLRPPVRVSYKGHEVYGMGPPSSGGIVIAQVLNMLEPYNLKADGRDAPRTLHRVTEAMRRAFFTRATLLADPDFVPIAVDQLISKAYAAEQARTIGDRATPSAALASFKIDRAEGEHTTHLSTIDQAGSAVALTYTLEDSFGAKCVVAGAGFLLNNEMGDFNLIPDRTDASGRIGTAPNLIAPGKRMLSSQAPTLVLKDGKVLVVTGSPGGRTIPNTALWVVLNLLEFGLDPRAAVDAPRTHHQWFPDKLLLEGRSWSQATRDTLIGLGHHLGTLERQGNANTIVVDRVTGRLHGVADHRRETSAGAGD